MQQILKSTYIDILTHPLQFWPPDQQRLNITTQLQRRGLERVIFLSIASDIAVCLSGQAMDNWVALGFAYCRRHNEHGQRP